MDPTLSKTEKARGLALSANNHVPALFKRIPWQRGDINADLGAGRFNTGTLYLTKLGVRNIVLDPAGLPPWRNDSNIALLKRRRTDTVTIANVLNVVRAPRDRWELLMLADAIVKKDGRIYIWIYEGDRSSIGRKTRRGYQANRATGSYLHEVRKVLDVLEHKGQMITARRKP